MAAEIILPRLDEAMTSGRILCWRKKEGEWVEKGETVFELETEKVIFEVEAPESGILNIVIMKIGEEIPIGEVVAYILQPKETVPEVPQPIAQSLHRKIVREGYHAIP